MRQLAVAGGPQPQPAPQLQHQRLADQGPQRQQHRQLQQLGAVALASCQQGGQQSHQHRHHQAALQNFVERVGPQQAGHRQPGQPRHRAQPLGQQQRGGHEQRQGADMQAQPELAGLHHQQRRQRQQRLARFEAGPPATHHQQQHRHRRQGLAEMAQPGQRPRSPVDQPEGIEHIKGLGADRFTLAGDQIPLAHRDRRQAIAGDQLLDPLLAEQGIAAQVGAALQAAGHQAAAQLTADAGLLDQMQSGRLQQGFLRHIGHHALAQHAQLGGAHGLLPRRQQDRIEAADPAALDVGEVERVDPGLAAVALLAQLAEGALQLADQLLAGPFIDHFHRGARHHLAAALLQGGAVHHRGIAGGAHGEGSRHAGAQAGLHQPGPAGEQRHQQAADHHGQQAAGPPADDGLAGPLQPQQTAPQGSEPPHRLGHRAATLSAFAVLKLTLLPHRHAGDRSSAPADGHPPRRTQPGRCH